MIDETRLNNRTPSGTHWIETPVIWKTRKKYECSNCGSYVTGRFLFTPVEQVHRFCHTCGSHITGETVNLEPDERESTILDT